VSHHIISILKVQEVPETIFLDTLE